jgi:hypothetical protein
MANQSIRDENPALTAVVTGTVNGGDHQLYPSNYLSQFSNVGQYPIDVTLGIT